MNRILLGGRYSSGTTPAPAPDVPLRPAPRAVFGARCAAASCWGAPGAGRLRFLAASAASRACLRSVHACQYSSPAPSATHKLTLLCLAVALVLFEFFRSSFSLYCRITSGPGEIQRHGLAEQLEPVYFVDCVFG